MLRMSVFRKRKQTRVCFTVAWEKLSNNIENSPFSHHGVVLLSTSNNSECDRRGQTAKFWKWVHQQNLFQATNICCGQEQLKNRKITAFPDSRQLLNTNKKRSASSCLLRPKDAKMPQAKLKTTTIAMTDCYKHWKKENPMFCVLKVSKLCISFLASFLHFVLWQQY